jgi:hypothetical protein
VNIYVIQNVLTTHTQNYTTKRPKNLMDRLLIVAPVPITGAKILCGCSEFNHNFSVPLAPFSEVVIST